MEQKLNFAEFSLVAFPNPTQTEAIALWKKLLKKLIGPFTSWDSKGHQTIAQFWNEKELLHYLPRIRTFCNLVIPTEVTFDDFVFGNKTFFISANKASKFYLNNLIKNFHIHLSKKNQGIQAHISIARELDTNQMDIAKELFKNTSVNFKFMCKELHLRKYNPNTKQYSDSIEIFELTGKPQPDLFSI